MIRLFVALQLPSALKQRLVIMGGGVPGARWQTEDQYHLTLRFIGDVAESTARDVDDALAAIRAPAFDLELAGVGEFGGKITRVLWAGVRPNEGLNHLQKKIETALQRLGLPAEERKYTPHVTMARMKGAPKGKVMEFLTHNALFSSGPFRVDHFALFSSQLSSNGALYRVERAYALE
jgi:2'-5' RNA ligase